MGFSNVTKQSGVAFTGTTWSAAWGDVDGDGLLDLWISNHNARSEHVATYSFSLWHNNGNGTFTDITSIAQNQYRDFHGSRWADIDNDGDQDMLVVHSTENGYPVSLYENADSRLTNIDVAAGFYVENGYTLGRNGVLFDYDHDGLLDLYFGADRLSFLPPGTLPDTMVFRQVSPNAFVQTTTDVGLIQSAGTALLADLDGDGWQELLFSRYGASAEIYDTHTETGVWRNVRSQWMPGPRPANFADAVIADFDNDLRPDVFMTRSGVTDEVSLRNPHEIRSYISDAGEQKSFSFLAPGKVGFIFPRPDGAVDLSLVHVGASGRYPFSENPADRDFVLSPTNVADQGLAPQEEPGIYIGYDVAAERWNYVVVPRPASFAGFPSRGVIINSPATISDLQTDGIVLDPPDTPDSFFLNDGTRLVDASVSSGIAGMTVYGRNCAAGDFDNDGDVDIYVDQATPALNRPNVFLINDGTGHFTMLADPGASGAVLGTGGAVAVADYDQDGRLDIVNLAGGSNPPFNALQDGPAQLLRNIPVFDGLHHWLEVRLHGNGVDTPIDAIGAKVFIEAGGKTQYREAIGGQHLEAQDSPVLHFGLGHDATVTRLEVRWPNGTTTIETGVASNHILDVVQPEPPAPAGQKLGLLEVPGQADGAGDGVGSGVGHGAADTGSDGGSLLFSLLVPADGGGGVLGPDAGDLLQLQPIAADELAAGAPVPGAAADAGGASAPGDSAEAALAAAAGDWLVS